MTILIFIIFIFAVGIAYYRFRQYPEGEELLKIEWGRNKFGLAKSQIFKKANEELSKLKERSDEMDR